jgi:hypothetical protein
VDGSALLNFYHRELGDVAAAVFLAEGKDRPYHARLADYFRFKADPKADLSWTGHYPHGLSELPYHLTSADKLDELYDTLTDYLFLQHKVGEVGVAERVDAQDKVVKTYGGVYFLQDDFGLALAKFGGGSEGGGRKRLIVTGVDFGKGLVINCPWCNKQSPLQKIWIGTDIACPQCQGPLLVNQFVVGKPA